MVEAGRTEQRLILASGSSARRQMLSAAGIAFEVLPSQVDEAAIKSAILRDSQIDSDTPAQIARELAAAKALEVGRRFPDALVIGSDQVLSLERADAMGPDFELFDKPACRDETRMHLGKMRGRRHALISAVALVAAGQVVWEHGDTARMTMRHFSDAFLDDYLVQAGDGVLGSVGCYQLEGLGIQLFETSALRDLALERILLLPLLAELRRRKVIPT